MLVVIVVVLGVLVDPDVSPIGFARSVSATTASICRLFRFRGPAKVTASIISSAPELALELLWVGIPVESQLSLFGDPGKSGPLYQP